MLDELKILYVLHNTTITDTVSAMKVKKKYFHHTVVLLPVPSSRFLLEFCSEPLGGTLILKWESAV